MSKYTTEVRYICEFEAGYNESHGWNDVDTTLDKSWNKIFTTNCAFFDDNYRSVLCKKILKHYYLREICSETVGIWKLWLNTRLEELMPYYNQLYNSALIEFDPMRNVDLRKTGNKATNLSKKTDEESNGNSRDIEDIDNTHSNTGSMTSSTDESGSNSGTSSNTNKKTGTETKSNTGGSTDAETNLYSDTPQGGISGLESNTYLTNATKNSKTNSHNDSDTTTYNTTTTDNGSTSNTNTFESDTSTATTDSGANNTDRTLNSTYSRTNERNTTAGTTEDYIHNVVGNNGMNNSESLMKFRETFLNIDRQIINEFSDLFFGLW